MKYLTLITVIFITGCVTRQASHLNDGKLVTKQEQHNTKEVVEIDGRYFQKTIIVVESYEEVFMTTEEPMQELPGYPIQ